METSRNLDFVTRPRARLSWQLEAHLAADRIRAVLMGSACLEALWLSTPRVRHGSTGCVRWYRDPVERASREYRMICTSRMNRLEKIDMCTVVPYE